MHSRASKFSARIRQQTETENILDLSLSFSMTLYLWELKNCRYQVDKRTDKQEVVTCANQLTTLNNIRQHYKMSSMSMLLIVYLINLIALFLISQVQTAAGKHRNHIMWNIMKLCEIFSIQSLS